MRRGNRIALSLALLTLVMSSTSGQDATVTVKVLDKRKSPVVGTVFLNPGKLLLGKTALTGEYKFSHKCAIGQTFKAEPEDRAKYYDSEEQVCGTLVELEVFPRPQHFVNANDFAIFKSVDNPVDTSKSKIYAGVFVGVAGKIEIISGGRNGKCKLTLDKRFSFGVYDVKADSWMQLDERKLRLGSQNDDAVYVFPSNCDEAQLQILELKKQANVEVKATALSISNSPDFGEAVVKAVGGRKF
jgi:hypothetical protein